MYSLIRTLHCIHAQAVIGFKKRRKEELLDQLCTAYSSRCSCPDAPLLRRYRRLAGEKERKLLQLQQSGCSRVGVRQKARSENENVCGYEVLKFCG